MESRIPTDIRELRAALEASERPGLRFSLASGLHVLAAHARRHLWQALGVRRAAERAAG